MSNTKQQRLNEWKTGLVKKLYCIQYYGGKCKKCSEDLINNPSKATFHHKNKDNKEIEPRAALKLEISETLKELDKCDLLCHNCHSEEHFNIDNWKLYKEEILSRTKETLKNSRKIIVPNINRIIEYHNKGHTPSKIAKLVGCTIPTIYKTLHELKLTPNVRVPKRNFTQEEFNEIKKLRHEGYSYEKIAKLVGCTGAALKYHKEKIN